MELERFGLRKLLLITFSLLIASGVWGDSLQILFEELDHEELKTISPLCKGAARFDPDYKDYCNKQYNTARHGITSQVTFEDLNLDELQSLSPLCRGEMRTDPDFKDYCFKQYNEAKYGKKYTEIAEDEPKRIGGERKLQIFRWGAAYLTQIINEKITNRKIAKAPK